MPTIFGAAFGLGLRFNAAPGPVFAESFFTYVVEDRRKIAQEAL
jgi:hypothetical protein